MLTNYNDILRKKISEGLKYNEELCIIEAIEFFNTLSYNEQENILRLALADFYKLNYYSTNEIHDIFKTKIEDIIDEYIIDQNFVIQLMQSIKQFNDMDYVSKCIIMETMQNNNQDYNIISIFPSHILDKLTYQIVDNIENYKEYYKNYIEVNKNNPKCIETITHFIIIRILELKKNDYNKYQKYILEFIKVYYKWKNFIRKHDGQYILNKCDFDYLNKIETYSIDNLNNEIEHNFEFLFTLVLEYFHYSISKLEIKEEIVDKYFEISSDNKIKEKLKIK